MACQSAIYVNNCRKNLTKQISTTLSSRVSAKSWPKVRNYCRACVTSKMRRHWGIQRVEKSWQTKQWRRVKQLVAWYTTRTKLLLSRKYCLTAIWPIKACGRKKCTKMSENEVCCQARAYIWRKDRQARRDHEGRWFKGAKIRQNESEHEAQLTL